MFKKFLATRNPYQEKLWTKDFIKVGSLALFANICIQMLISSFPIYLEQLGSSATMIGSVATGYTICAMLVRFVAGNIIDKKGRLIVGIVGLILLGIPLFGYISFPIVALTVCFRMVQGFGASATTITTGTMVVDVLPKSRMAEGVGYYGLFTSLAIAVGPAVGLALIEINPNIVFICSIVAVIVSFTILMTLRYEKSPAFLEKVAREDAEETPVSPDQYKGIWKFFEKKSMPSGVLTIMIAICTATSVNFLSLFATSLGLANVSFYFVIQAIFMLLVRLFGGRLSSRFGQYNMLIMSFSVIIVSYLLMAFINSTALLYISAAVYGIGCGFCWPNLNVLALSGVPRTRRGTANSTYLASYDVGAGIGALIWGVVIDLFRNSIFGGYRPIFILSSILIFVTILMTIYLKKRYPCELDQ
ncbi:MFS transporter [Gehongia tenuis]|uniref:MFS transporter n=1 Tax=Gehongia tenuis TaxID=2763655 RepID=A0A926HQL8_9FIRM|nr:MFS transporter [Gehongia tenuis]MBC8531875.1 MFS transporter [Gehongia tenuis]